MMTLISLAIIVAFATSFAATLGRFEIDVWWELASLITITALGHWLEMRAVSQARGTPNALAALLPDTAERVNGAEVQAVPLAELHVGDVVLVRPGTRVPADGAVVEGAAEVDESMITGEFKAGCVRYRSRVLNPTPRCRQNSSRINPPDSYSATNCSTSCRLRRRRTANTCSWGRQAI
jgi:Cu2+-exporting ATPase